EYLFALRAAIGKAIEKGMQDGLSAGITHDKDGRVLLKSSKDDSVEAVMDILCLEGPLAKKLGLNKLQPNVDHSSFTRTSAKGTSNTAVVTADTTMVLSATFVSAAPLLPSL
nr:hypothetical protein [Tanacetum cinerariifolium]